MGVHSELVVAHESEATEILEVDSPSSRWEGCWFQGLDHVKLAVLWAICEGRDPDDDFEERLSTMTFLGTDPSIAILDTSQRSALARIACCEEDEIQQLVSKLREVEEFEAWTVEDVLDFVRVVGDLSVTAELEGKSLIVWTAL